MPRCCQTSKISTSQFILIKSFPMVIVVYKNQLWDCKFSRNYICGIKKIFIPLCKKFHFFLRWINYIHLKYDIIFGWFIVCHTSTLSCFLKVIYTLNFLSHIQYPMIWLILYHQNSFNYSPYLKRHPLYLFWQQAINQGALNIPKAVVSIFWDTIPRE